MSNPYYEYTAPVSPGTTIRSNKYNSDQEGVQTGFNLVAQNVARAIKLNNTQALPMTLPDVITDSMLLISPTTGAGLYPMSTFTAAVQSAIDNASSALASKNAAATSESNSATSESNALTSKNAAATSASNALASKNAAAISASSAEADASNANTSKNAAATSASSALASKNAAATSAGNAASSETSANTSKNAANVSATNAASSESTAVAAAGTASTAATNANAHKNQAKIYRDEAEGFRDDAAQIAGGDAPNALKLGNQPPSYYTDIPSRLGYTPVQQGTGTGQLQNTIKIGWGVGGKLLLEVDETDYGNQWPIISSNATKFNGQLPSYYAKASDVQPATTSSRGTVEKATLAEMVAGEADKYPDSLSVKYGVAQIGKDFFVENDPKPIPNLSTPPENASFSFGYGGLHPSATEGDNPFPLDGGAFSLVTTGSAFSNNTYVSQIAIGYRGSKAGQEIKVRGVIDNTGDDCWVTLQHSHNLATQNDINNSVPEKASSAKAVKDFVDTRIPKKDVQHYNSTGNVTIDFSTARQHIVSRRGSGSGTITLTGTLLQGDTLIVENVQDNSGVATITGKNMFTGVGTESATTHTLTGQGTVTFTCFDGINLSVRGVY